MAAEDCTGTEASGADEVGSTDLISSEVAEPVGCNILERNAESMVVPITLEGNSELVSAAAGVELGKISDEEMLTLTN